MRCNARVSTRQYAARFGVDRYAGRHSDAHRHRLSPLFHVVKREPHLESLGGRDPECLIIDVGQHAGGHALPVGHTGADVFDRRRPQPARHRLETDQGPLAGTQLFERTFAEVGDHQRGVGVDAGHHGLACLGVGADDQLQVGDDAVARSVDLAEIEIQLGVVQAGLGLGDRRVLGRRCGRPVSARCC